MLLVPLHGFELPFQFTFPYSDIVVAILSTILIIYGGRPFYQGAVDEFKQKTLSRQSLLTHDRKEGSAYNEGEQYKSVVFNRAFPSLYKKLVEQES